jgi:hypothetical protein
MKLLNRRVLKVDSQEMCNCRAGPTKARGVAMAEGVIEEEDEDEEDEDDEEQAAKLHTGEGVHQESFASPSARPRSLLLLLLLLSSALFSSPPSASSHHSLLVAASAIKMRPNDVSLLLRKWLLL